MAHRQPTTPITKVGLHSDQSARTAQQRLRSLADPAVAAVSARFFKTGPGEYGEGDVFLGVRVPVIRKVAKEFNGLPISEAESLLHSEFHEERLLALVIMVSHFEKGDDATRKRVYDLYLSNARYINNWDLVDLSAPQIVGGYQEGKSRRPLHRLAKSANLWERRIAILATFHFIRRGDFADTLKVAEMLLKDKEDLIHKAVGWMLREIGKRDVATLEAFLGKHCQVMPRTMLRYAIERFSDEKRREYLQAGKARAK